MSETKGSSPGALHIVSGLVCSCILWVAILSVAVTFLVGSYVYPTYIGLGVVLPYYTYTLFVDRRELKDGSPWQFFSQHFFIFSSMRKFLQMTIVLSDELRHAENKADPNKPPQFLFGVFPHGSNCDFRILMDGMMFDSFPKIKSSTRTLAASVLFRIPLVREFALWTGCIDASRPVAERTLKRGGSILVLPGGEAEQIRTEHGKEKIFLNSRKGFVKLALKHGVPLVPAYVFGASDYYRTSMLFYDLRLWLVKNLGICIPFAFGVYGTVLAPHPVKTTIVFGKPLHFPVKEEGAPSAEELNDAHGQFCKELTLLFDTHKKSLGYGDRQLEIM